MQVLEVRPVPFAAHAGVALGRLHLDDLGAPVGELPHRGRTGAHAGQIDHLEAGEGTLAQRSTHCGVILVVTRFVKNSLHGLHVTSSYGNNADVPSSRTFVMKRHGIEP